MVAYTFHLSAQGTKAGISDSLRPVSLRPAKATQWEPVSTTTTKQQQQQGNNQPNKGFYSFRAGKVWSFSPVPHFPPLQVLRIQALQLKLSKLGPWLLSLALGYSGRCRHSQDVHAHTRFPNWLLHSHPLVASATCSRDTGPLIHFTIPAWSSVGKGTGVEVPRGL